MAWIRHCSTRLVVIVEADITKSIQLLLVQVCLKPKLDVPKLLHFLLKLELGVCRPFYLLLKIELDIFAIANALLKREFDKPSFLMLLLTIGYATLGKVVC